MAWCAEGRGDLPVARTLIELGEFELAGGPRQRWLAVSATTAPELRQTVNKAQERGWEPIEQYEGVDPKTGWPCIWMAKGLPELKSNCDLDRSPPTCIAGTSTEIE